MRKQLLLNNFFCILDKWMANILTIYPICLNRQFYLFTNIKINSLGISREFWCLYKRQGCLLHIKSTVNKHMVYMELRHNGIGN